MTRERETIARIIEENPDPGLAADAILLALGPGEGLTERVTVLEAAIRWALGEGDSDFGDNIPTVRFLGGKPARYWWRTELRERAALPSPPIPNREGERKQDQELIPSRDLGPASAAQDAET
jgi:hypothetical protein